MSLEKIINERKIITSKKDIDQVGKIQERRWWPHTDFRNYGEVTRGHTGVLLTWGHYLGVYDIPRHMIVSCRAQNFQLFLLNNYNAYLG